MEQPNKSQNQFQQQHQSQKDTTQTVGTEVESSQKLWSDLSQRAKIIRDKLRYGEEVPATLFWTAEEAGRFFKLRATRNLQTGFKVDDANRAVFKLLCFYFSNDKRFYEIAAELKIANPDLQKGIYLAGDVGVGKTLLMRVCGANMRQSFQVKSAKAIANEYEAAGMDAVEKYNRVISAPNSFDNFYHSQVGLCLDDLGTEDIKTYMGNRKNVVGDIIEARYSNFCVGRLLHVTTNLSHKEMNSYYGSRVTSRLQQIVNIVRLKGPDRRKTELHPEELLRSFDISPFQNASLTAREIEESENRRKLGIVA